MQGGGNLLQGLGSIISGVQEERTAGVEAKDTEIAAGQASAAGQRGFATAERQKDLVESRARAISGASGAGAGDVSVINDEADIGRAGEYQALTALYNGASQARSLNYQAQMTRFAGSNALIGSIIGGVAQAAGGGNASSANSWLQKYGGQLPAWMGLDSGGTDMMPQGGYG